MDKKDKNEYFRELYSLQNDSDNEEDTSNARDTLKNSKPPAASSFSAPPQSASRKRNHQAMGLKKVPGILRTTSEPIPGGKSVRSTLPTSQDKSLLHYDVSDCNVSTFDEMKTSLRQPNSSNSKPHLPNENKLEPVRHVSTPNIGSIVMKNSTGINSMLKKRKRKDSAVKLVAEAERIFANKVFFYIPPNDIAPLRKVRIAKARSYGATWTKEWTPDITHVVVDKELEYQDVLDYLRPLINSDVLPPNVLLVNEEYPIDCTRFRSLLDPTQKRYIVINVDAEANNIELDSSETHDTNTSLQVKKANPNKWNDASMNKIITPSQNSTQAERLNTKLSPGIWPQGQTVKESQLIESPRDTKLPRLDRDPLKPGDGLDDMIQVALRFSHLPIDDYEEEEDERPSSRDDLVDSGSEEEAAAARVSKRRYAKKGTFHQENFSCMEGGTGVTLDSNPNKETIEVLREMADYYGRIQDHWRSLAYRKAIRTLKKQPSKISTYDEALSLTTIGHRLAKKIEEIVLTHGLRRLDNARLEPQDQILQLFLKIYDVGPSQASRWINAGYKTLDDLKAKAQLTANQRIGIEHFDDLNSRIPREEVTALGEVVKNAIAAIDPRVEAIIGGSYRRGAATSGDIDFIITRPGTNSSHELLPFLHDLTTSLTSSGFLVAALATPRHDDGSKWHGACALTSSSVWRRIDFLLVPDSEIGATLIYFTGDDIFNRSIRLLSSKKGWRLNQRGLYADVMRGPGRVKLNKGSLIEGRDERKIFEILGVPWRPPEHRICQ